MEEYYARLAEHLPSVIVCTPRVTGWREADRSSALRIFRPPFERFAARKFAWVILWWIWVVVLAVRFRVRMLHCGNVTPTGYLGHWTKKALGVPYAIHFHGMDAVRAADKLHRGGLRARALRAILREAELCFANSADTAQRLAALGVEPGRTTVVNPGVDSTRFAPASDGAREARSTKVLLTVGRYAKRKGIDRVICALPRIRQVVDCELVIVGRDHAENLAPLVRELGLENAVRFAGEVAPEELPQFYRRADVFVMPSFEDEDSGSVEGFGIVFLEAAASGIPAIGGRSGGIGDAVADGETGFLVDPEDEDELVEKCVRLLESEELRRKMGERARRRAVEQFSWDEFGRKVEGAFLAR
jgi:phosphatidylinositol alpha-1,6-mannosyltransferase